MTLFSDMNVLRGFRHMFRSALRPTGFGVKPDLVSTSIAFMSLACGCALLLSAAGWVWSPVVSLTPEGTRESAIFAVSRAGARILFPAYWFLIVLFIALWRQAGLLLAGDRVPLAYNLEWCLLSGMPMMLIAAVQGFLNILWPGGDSTLSPVVLARLWLSILLFLAGIAWEGWIWFSIARANLQRGKYATLVIWALPYFILSGLLLFFFVIL